MTTENFSDENDVEKNNDNGSTTFSLDDDDECVIEDIEGDDSDEDSVEHRVTMNKMFLEGNDEDDNYNIHDQLPSVEEVKASNAYLPTMRLLAKGHRRKLYLTIASAALAAIVISVTISIGVFASANKNKNQATDPHVVNAEQSNISDRFDHIVDFVFSHHISTLPALRNPKSPEHYAVKFLAAGDAFHAEIGEYFDLDTERLLERYVIALLYYKTQGTKWDDDLNFLSGNDHCEWHKVYSNPQGSFIRGVQCDDDGLVVDIDLSNNNVNVESVPSALEYLKNLETLHLYGNPIGGYFPKSLTKLTKLKSLGLFNTDIAGTIPMSVGDMTSLTTLALGQTKISETIPFTFSALTNLRILGLDGLGLTGAINPLLNLEKLEALYLEDNNLTGVIYNQKWRNMKELDLSNNVINSRLPETFFQNTNLRVADLHGNRFFGPLPHDFLSNDSIEYIALQNNDFTGTLSERIGYFKNLKHLDISRNEISGTIPDTLSMLTNLISLATNGNSFERQPILGTFEPLKDLEELSLKGNSFTGTLPDYFATLNNLKLFDLDGNDLTGTIPTFYGIMFNLEALMLNRNYLTGTIPTELSKLSKLQILLLDGNDLKGKTDEICEAKFKSMKHFITDCYPSMLNDEGPEVECRCCSLCCNDENSRCNNKDWSSNYDLKTKYGFIRPAYEFSLDQAPEDWRKKAAEGALVQSSF